MDSEISIKNWRLQDIVIAVCIILFSSLGTAVLLAHLIPVSKLVLDILASGINLVAIFYLHRKYPLKLFGPVDITKAAKYLFVGTILCLIINFPHKIWAGNFNKIPIEYTRFVKSNLFEKGGFLLMLCLIGPMLEELLFRGYFYRILRNKYSIISGALISTAIFTVLHGIQLTNFLYIAMPSLIFTYVYEKTGSIWTSGITHSLMNSFWFIFVVLGMKQYIGP